MELVSKERNEQRFNNMIESIENNFCTINFAKRLGVDGTKPIEVKFYDNDEEFWMVAYVSDMNTNETYLFEDDGDDEGERVSVYEIKFEDGEKRKICFLSERFIFSTEYEEINLWRHVGSTFDMTKEQMYDDIYGNDGGDGEGDEDDESDSDWGDEAKGEKIMNIEFSSINGLRNKIDRLTGVIFVNILKYHEINTSSMNYCQKRDFENAVLMMKNELTKNIVDYIVNSGSFRTGSCDLFSEVMKDIAEKTIQSVKANMINEHEDMIRKALL